MLSDRRASSLGLGASSSSWATIGDARADASAVAILPHGVDGHVVREVVAGMRLQHCVLLTANLHVRAPASCPPPCH